MIPPRLSPVSLSELRALPEGKYWLVNQAIHGLESLTPVRGTLQAIHHGTVLEVAAEVETIVTLSCGRCLQQFNLCLRADVKELIEFHGPSSREPDPMPPVLGTDLDDRLDPGGSFDPERWLFEQLNLRLPLVPRCGEDCPGPASWGSAPATDDPRWAALRALSPTSLPTQV